MAATHPTLDWIVTEEKVLQALERLIAAADPVKIIAFGSRAKGNAREDSDLDLAVILPGDTVLKDTSLCVGALRTLAFRRPARDQ